MVAPKRMGFLLHADGKTYGPYRSNEEDKVKRLLHLKGITVEYVMVPATDLLPPPKPRKKEPKPQLSLLDGIDFMPTAKRRL